MICGVYMKGYFLAEYYAVPVCDPGVGEREADQPGTVGADPPNPAVGQSLAAPQIQVTQAGRQRVQTQVPEEANLPHIEELQPRVPQENLAQHSAAANRVLVTGLLVTLSQAELSSHTSQICRYL